MFVFYGICHLVVAGQCRLRDEETQQFGIGLTRRQLEFEILRDKREALRKIYIGDKGSFLCGGICYCEGCGYDGTRFCFNNIFCNFRGGYNDAAGCVEPGCYAAVDINIFFLERSPF